MLKPGNLVFIAGTLSKAPTEVYEQDCTELNEKLRIRINFLKSNLSVSESTFNQIKEETLKG